MSDLELHIPKLDTIINLLHNQGATLMSLSTDLQAVSDQLNKALAEIGAKLADLSVDPAVLDGLKAAAQALDDVVPDPEPPVA